MPLEHSERLKDVERSVELVAATGDADAADYARRHASVIRQFGRYPARNAVLGRATTAEEAAFLAKHPVGF